VVIDTDGQEGEALVAEFQAKRGAFHTLTIRSGSGRGHHYYFLHPGYRVTTVAHTSIKIDIKGDGGFCVLPPTLHKSGERYGTVAGDRPAALPEGLLEFIAEKAAAKSGKAKGGPGVPGAGSRVLGANEGSLSGLGVNISTRLFDGPPPSVEEMRARLTLLKERGFFANRDGIVNDDAGSIVDIGWRECGMALKAAYGDEGFDLWAEIHRDDEARAHAPKQYDSFHVEAEARDVTIGTVIKASNGCGFIAGSVVDPSAFSDVAGEGVSINDFRAYMPMHLYIYMPTREMWPAISVDARRQ
jgi:hypothetical protein